MRKLILLSLFILPACIPCEPETFDLGKLSKEALILVPYSDGDTVRLIHSNGFAFNLEISRESYTREENVCSECCDIYIFEENICTFTPDYPLISGNITLRNYDSINFECFILINTSWFSLNSYQIENSILDQIDSMRIGNETYYDIFTLPRQEYTIDSNEGSIYPDSLYFNSSDGILKISMSNDEYYQISN